jgi:hypothetical protein
LAPASRVAQAFAAAAAFGSRVASLSPLAPAAAPKLVQTKTADQTKTAASANSVPAPQRAALVQSSHDVAAAAPARPALMQVASAGPMPLPATPSMNTLQKPIAPQPPANPLLSLPGATAHTAVYDIEAHTVYLPDGTRLEAHSGLGARLDDPHAINVKDRGPTPPNVYDLAMREEPFHGVRALRLNPVGDAKMYGRDGILAHTYMLGPSGQSFGCVSFKDYQAFLQAYMRGDVDRLVVVPHLDVKPGDDSHSRSATAHWWNIFASR